MKHLFVDIMLDGRFYGTLRIRNKWGGALALEQRELAEIVERRLPLLKNKNYKIRF